MAKLHLIPAVVETTVVVKEQEKLNLEITLEEAIYLRSLLAPTNGILGYQLYSALYDANIPESYAPNCFRGIRPEVGVEELEVNIKKIADEYRKAHRKG